MMVQKTLLMWGLLIAMTGTMAACGDDDDDNEKDTADDKGTETEQEDGGVKDGGDESTEGQEDAEITGKISIPSDFDGEPAILAFNFFKDLSTGMPDKFGDVIESPEITAGEDYEFTISQKSTGKQITGDYYLAVTLYCEGGGGGAVPVPGTDWVGATNDALTLGEDTGAVDTGTIELILLQGEK